MGKKLRVKTEALEIVDKLFELSLETISHDFELAQKQASLARRIMMKFNLRPGYRLKRFICHGCKRLIVPGVNARVRISAHRKAIITTCTMCGYRNRKILGQA